MALPLIPLDLGVPLLAAHLVGDFVLQTTGMVREKHRWTVMALHCALVAVLSYAFVGRWGLWQVPALIWVAHGIIDRLKIQFGRNNASSFVLDQFAHGAVVAWIAWGWSGYGGQSAWTDALGPRVGAGWIVICGAILCVRVGGFMIGYWVQPYLDEIRRTVEAEPTSVKPTGGLSSGGRVIGQWERALIFLFVGLGQPASIGFLVTAKSIFRFGELKDRENRMEAEYITIGTLMSFGWAIVVSYVTWHLAR